MGLRITYFEENTEGIRAIFDMALLAEACFLQGTR